ncbi:hypothetical protein CRG98_006455 [Punica granatum]|uniref:RNase H type-1 domain-containing protein n=1 Tax=Punica granatum TaxID=22663 RepID=A0A2I0KXH7_PUNGR|nr:hypothetical protein CRG98_006455 [Punica granatum]
MDEEKEEPTWKMYFDGAVNSMGSGVGVVLISPDGRHYPVAVKVDFSCTNNVVEYEACILGLQAAIDFKVKELEVFESSQTLAHSHSSCDPLPRPKPAGTAGLGTFGSAHGHLDPSLRSPTNPTLHCAVLGARMPTRFSTDCRGCQHPGHPPVALHLSLATPTATSPTLFLVYRG